MSLFDSISIRIKSHLNDPHEREVAVGAIIALVLKITAAILVFLFNVAVVRVLGASDSGLFFLSLAITAIASVIGRVGLDNVLLRKISSGAAADDWEEVFSAHAKGIRIAMYASGAIALLLFFSSTWLSLWVFKKDDLAEPLRWMSLSILPFAILNLQAESFKGLKNIRNAMLIQGIGIPFIALILLFPLVYYSGVIGASLAYAFACAIVSALGFWLWKKTAAQYGQQNKRNINLWPSCKPLYLTSLVNNALLPWSPILLLGLFSSNEQVGIYSVAARISALVSFLFVTVNYSIAPKYAELYSKGKVDQMGRLARKSSFILLALVTPVSLALVIFSDRVMSIFGHEFAQDGSILTILIAGQFVIVLVGSVSPLLIMSGNEKIFRNISVSIGLLQVMLAALLTYYFDATGSAIATSSGLIVSNIALGYAVYKKLGISMLPRFRLGL